MILAFLCLGDMESLQLPDIFGRLFEETFHVIRESGYLCAVLQFGGSPHKLAP